MGYFLKIVIADNLKDQTFWISYPYFQRLSSIDLITMLVGYSCQIFADFCGYSLIALGSAELFGYQLIQNFNWPYISKSFSEFWTRWHISLSSFLKEYLYIPLGGNRRGNLRTYINLFIVMFLGGLWHGAAWSYAVWGSAHGVLLILERLISRQLAPMLQWIPRPLLNALQITLVFSSVTLIWLLFRLPNFSEVLMYLKAVVANVHLPMGKSRIFLNLMYCFPVFALHFYYFCKETFRAQMPLAGKLFIYSFMLYMLITNYGTSSEFIYFQF
jgi:alginate O-acetyltransferase complex protein AlgI